MDGSAAPRRTFARLGRAGLAVTAANAVVNLMAYLVPVLAARRLSPADFGELATAMALVAIATMPGVGLQTAVAVATARGGAASRGIGRLAAATAVSCGGVLLLATPVCAVALDLSGVVPPLLAAMTVPVVLAGWPLGLLQGRERFGWLAAGMGLLAVGRYAGVVVGLLAGAGVAGALACGAVGALVVLPPLLLSALRRPAAVVAGCTGTTAPTASARASAAPGGGVLRGRDVFTAASASLAILVASYADLILARRLLPPAESGAYAVGAVLTRAAIWAPQMVTVVALPRLARQRGRVLSVGLGLVSVAGALLVAVTIGGADVAVGAVGGVRYAALAALAPYFVAVGARWPAAPLWMVLAGLVGTVVVLRPATVGHLLACAVGGAVASAAATGVAVRWRRGGFMAAAR